jgi:hypothetical protein
MNLPSTIIRLSTSRTIWLGLFATGVVVVLIAVRAIFADARTPVAPSPSAAASATLVKSERVRGELMTIRLEPLAGRPRIGVTDEWSVVVTNERGLPQKDCQVAFDGTMPAHGHGLPTAPRVSASPEAGRYRVEGVRFSMGGYWQLDVVATCGNALQRARFDLRL